MPAKKISQGVDLRGSGVWVQVRSLTASAALLVSDHVVLVDATAGAVTLTLPPAASLGPGFRYQLHKIDASANAVTVDANATETIDGATTKTIAAQWGSLALFVGPNGDKWYAQSPEPVSGALVVAGSLSVAGPVFVGDTSNAKNVAGATINQGANDDGALSLKSTDVGHGMTTRTETDTFEEHGKVSAANGGAAIRGYSAGTIGALVVGAHTTGNTSKSTAATANVYLQSSLKSGTDFGANGATDNITVFSDHGSARMVFQSDGSPYCDVGTAWTNYDDHDDVALLTDLSRAVSRPDDPIHAAFRDFADADRARVQALDLIHFNDDGHHFMNLSKMQMLLVGAVRQLGDRLAAASAEIEAMKTQLALKEA